MQRSWISFITGKNIKCTTTEESSLAHLMTQEIMLLDIYPREVKVYPYKIMHMIVYRSFICKNPN